MYGVRKVGNFAIYLENGMR